MLEARGAFACPRAFRDVSLQVRAGEVLGIYGFMGCGQLELARALFGKLRPSRARCASTAAGALRAAPRRAARRHRLRAGEPALHALPPGAGLQEHLDQHPRPHLAALAAGRRAERAIAHEQVERLQIRPAAVEPRLGTLSGGNQQKVALAKWLTLSAEGADPERADARHGCRRQGRRGEDRAAVCATQGIGVIVVSTEPETVLSLADRILVMKRGEIVREFANETVSKDRLLEAA